MALNTCYLGNWRRFGCSVQPQVPLHSSWRAEPSAPGTAHPAHSILQFRNHLHCSKSFIIFLELFITPLVFWTPQIFLFSVLDENHKGQDAATLLRTPMITFTALSQLFHDFYFLSWLKKEQRQGLTGPSWQLWCCLVTQRWICSEQLTENPLLPLSTNLTLNFFSLQTGENWLSTRRGA